MWFALVWCVCIIQPTMDTNELVITAYNLDWYYHSKVLNPASYMSCICILFTHQICLHHTTNHGYQWTCYNCLQPWLILSYTGFPRQILNNLDIVCLSEHQLDQCEFNKMINRRADFQCLLWHSKDLWDLYKYDWILCCVNNMVQDNG